MSLAAAAAALSLFGFVAYKLIGAGGVVGVVVIAIAIALNLMVIRIEDEEDDGFK